jgi:hypothetical protein
LDERDIARKKCQQDSRQLILPIWDNGLILEVKGIWLGAIETSGKQSTKTESFQAEGLNTYLLDHVSRCEGLINNLEPGLKDLIDTSFCRQDPQSKFAENHHVVLNISASYDSSNDGKLFIVFAERLALFQPTTEYHSGSLRQKRLVRFRKGVSECHLV